MDTDKCDKCEWVWSEDHPVHEHGGKPYYVVCYTGAEQLYQSGFRTREAAQKVVDRLMRRTETKHEYWVENWS